MKDIDELLHALRADAPGPTEGADERIYDPAWESLTKAPVQHRRPRPAERLWPRIRWALLPFAVVVVASVMVTLGLASSDRGSDSRGVPGLLQSAEAAITTPREILELSMQIRRTTRDSTARDETIDVRQWSLSGVGHAALYRILISEGPLDQSPTDEDSTAVTDRSGRVIDTRSWTPLDTPEPGDDDDPGSGIRGLLTIVGERLPANGSPTLVAMLRKAYQRQLLRPAGRTADGGLRLSGGPALAGTAWGPCVRTEVVLDPETFIPRSIEITNRSEPCSSGSHVTDREIWTISSARSLPGTPVNRRLLAIGDWPTSRIVKSDEEGHRDLPIDRVPPVPDLDEG